MGGKSLHLKQLRGRLPDWVHLPVSVALPFGTFEKVLATDANRKIREHYDRLSAEVSHDPEMLQELRKTVMELVEPDDLDVALRETLEKAGLRPAEKYKKCMGMHQGRVGFQME